MKPRVYIETTIPSFYHETRPEPEMVARRNWTRAFWDSRRGEYELVTSDAVFDELARAVPRKGEAILDLLRGLDLLARTPEVMALAQHYIEQKVMPRGLYGDALHLALASWHGCHFLLTWNCSHLANANKVEHIRTVNRRRGLATPVLATPLELLNLEDHA